MTNTITTTTTEVTTKREFLTELQIPRISKIGNDDDGRKRHFYNL